MTVGVGLLELNDTRTLNAPIDQVWAALLTADILRQSVPGCQALDGTADDGFNATVTQKVGPVKATFKGVVTVSNVTAPHALTLTGEGKGGVAGFAKGCADVTLTDNGATTDITYTVEARVGGKLAQLGSRIIDSFARKMADQFFDNFQAVFDAADNFDTGGHDEG